MPPGVHDLPIRAADCLRLCYKLHEQGERISPSALCARLRALEPTGRLGRATVARMLGHLTQRGYVHRASAHDIELTPAGLVAAAALVRRHRLLELFLVRQMGFSLDAVDGEAVSRH